MEYGYEVCKKCEGTGAVAKKLHFDGITTVDCPKCHGAGKIDWITNAMWAIKDAGLFYDGSKIFETTPNSDIIFYCDGEEIIKTTKNGFYVKGKKIAEDEKLYDAFVDFFKQSGTY